VVGRAARTPATGFKCCPRQDENEDGDWWMEDPGRRRLDDFHANKRRRAQHFLNHNEQQQRMPGRDSREELHTHKSYPGPRVLRQLRTNFQSCKPSLMMTNARVAPARPRHRHHDNDDCDLRQRSCAKRIMLK